MDLRTLRYFTVAAQELNITRAAEKLAISQPPLSNAGSQEEFPLVRYSLWNGSGAVPSIPTRWAASIRMRQSAASQT